MSGILRRAKRQGWIAANPYDDAERVRVVDSGDFNVLTVEQVPESKVVRSVPLIDQAARALDGLSQRGVLIGPDDHVFLSPTGGPPDDSDIREGFYRALTAAGLGHLREQPEPIVFHDLRHTFGTLAVQVWPVTDV
ncbi:MAG TPA: tyrosine-type recombinase/integrase [Thermoleophilaceae bacterium]